MMSAGCRMRSWHGSTTARQRMRNPSTTGARWELAAGAFYQKALATGQEPGPHRTNVGTPLAPDVAEHVKEVYI